MSYNTYPNLPSAPPSENLQVGYHLNVVQAKRQGLINKGQMFKKKYKKYTKILNTRDRLRAKDRIRTLENMVKSLCFISTEWAVEFVVIFLFEVDLYLKHPKPSFD